MISNAAIWKTVLERLCRWFGEDFQGLKNRNMIASHLQVSALKKITS